MTNKKLYLNAFDLYEGLIIRGFKLIKIIIDKEVFNNYQSYAINMIWEKTRISSSKYKLMKELNIRSGKIIIYSPKRHIQKECGKECGKTNCGKKDSQKIVIPYKCDFGDLKFGYASDNFISIYSLGSCFCM